MSAVQVPSLRNTSQLKIIANSFFSHSFAFSIVFRKKFLRHLLGTNGKYCDRCEKRLFDEIFVQ